MYLHFFPLMSKKCVRYWQIPLCEGHINVRKFVGNWFRNIIPLKVCQFEPMASLILTMTSPLLLKVLGKSIILTIYADFTNRPRSPPISLIRCRGFYEILVTFFKKTIFFEKFRFLKILILENFDFLENVIDFFSTKILKSCV